MDLPGLKEQIVDPNTKIDTKDGRFSAFKKLKKFSNQKVNQKVKSLDLIFLKLEGVKNFMNLLYLMLFHN